MKTIKKPNINLSLLIPVVILCFFSLITLKNISPLLGNNVAYIDFFKKQFVGFLLGGIIIAIIYTINLKAFNKFFDVIYYILVVMLFILAFHPPIISDLFVNNQNGANGWFMLFSTKLSFQPVEFFKVILVLKLANISKEHLSGYTKDEWILKRYFLYGIIPILLILKEPDLGGVMLLGFTLFIMLLLSVKSKKTFRALLYFFIVGIIFVLLIIFSEPFENFLIRFTPLQSYQLERIDSWLKPFSTDKGYQLSQSLLFMGSAGPFGYGPGFNQISFPEAQTDLIFTVFVGFYGWVAGFILILAYLFLIYKIMGLAILQKDLYFKFIVIGYGSLLFLQVVENIGMLIGLLPITGIVLPFMSYGISALLTYSAILGILLNISKETDFDPTKYNKK